LATVAAVRTTVIGVKQQAPPFAAEFLKIKFEVESNEKEIKY
jgi:hypothetical protein